MEKLRREFENQNLINLINENQKCLINQKDEQIEVLKRQYANNMTELSELKLVFIFIFTVLPLHAHLNSEIKINWFFR